MNSKTYIALYVPREFNKSGTNTLNYIIMLKFYVSSNKKDFVSPILVMGKNDVACIKTIYRYWHKHNYKGLPVQVI